jgi:CrcB protein
MLKLLMLIGTGSFIGGVLRYLVSRSVQNTFISSFPYGTFTVNVIGCFLIGLIYGFSERGSILSPDLRLFLTVGFCGGFTTFSTFANESLSLLRDGDIFHFALYSGLSVFAGILVTYLGSLVTKLI